MTFTVRFAARVEKELSGLPRELQQRVFDRIIRLAENPFSQGTIKLRGEEAYRIRIGDYRVVFEVDRQVNIILILKVGHRSDIYR